MAHPYHSLQRDQLDELIRSLRRLSRISVPRGGWVRAIREALGMSASHLAARVGVSRQTVEDFERNEAGGKITLDSLNRLAQALNCRVVYALIPEKPLADLQRDRAREVADAMLKPVSHSMGLEAQSLSAKEEQRQLKRLVDKLLQGNPKKLWD